MATQFINKSTYGGIEKQFEKTPKNTLIVRGYFTSDNRDEVGDIITRSATERAISAYKQWGNIRLLHQPKPVAKVKRISLEDGLEWNEVEFEVIDPEAVFMVENGLLTALSVGILVNFDDVDFMQDGGLVINNYQLAEISLVDHPANYDAKLKDMVLDHDARMYALQYGFGALGNDNGGLKDMAKEKELEVPVPEETPVSSEPVVDEKDLHLEIPAQEEVAPVVEEEVVPAVEPEAPIAEDKSVDEPVVEEEVETPEPEAEAVSEEISEEKDKETSNEPEYIAEIREFLTQIGKDLEELKTKNIVVTESETNSSEEDKALDSDKDATIERLTAEIAEQKARIDALELQIGEQPAERKGLVEETSTDSFEPKDNAGQPKDLKSALANYLKTRY